MFYNLNSHPIIYLFCEFRFTADSWHSWGIHLEPSWIPRFTNTKNVYRNQLLRNHISMESFCSWPYATYLRVIHTSTSHNRFISHLIAISHRNTQTFSNSWMNVLQMHKSMKEDKAKWPVFCTDILQVEFSDSYLSQGRSHRVTNLQVEIHEHLGLNALI